MVTSYEQTQEWAAADQALAFIRGCTSECCSTEYSTSSSEPTHHLFHGNYWEGTYPPEGERPDGAGTVTVEYGVALFPDFAKTYYLRDFDGDCDSQYYGEELVYDWIGDGSVQSWYDALMAQLEQAPEVAWNSDLLTCDVCGYHYVAGADHGHESGD